jgi:hypothetical protein
MGIVSKRVRTRSTWKLVFALTCAAIGFFATCATQAQAGTITQQESAGSLKPALPLYFIPNQGQVSPDIQFYARGEGYGFSLGARGVAYAFLREGSANGATAPSQSGSLVIRIDFAGANSDVALSGEQPQAAKVNYLVGKNPNDWRTGIGTYESVRYTGLYPGIDLVYRGDSEKIKYEFDVAPHTDFGRIKFRYSGMSSLHLDESGNLIVSTSNGNLEDVRPIAYQTVNGHRVPVPADFVLTGDTVGFSAPGANPEYPLVIDPGLSAGLLYSTYIGGSGALPNNPGLPGECGEAIATRPCMNGDVVVVGITPKTPLPSSDFPTTLNVFQQANASSAVGGTDAFVTRLNSTGTALTFSTFLGGSGDDEAKGVDVDAVDQVYVCGRTWSSDFPVSGVLPAFQPNLEGSSDAFVTKLDPMGAGILYSTYLGGDSDDYAGGIRVQRVINSPAYVTGTSWWTTSVAFPVTLNAFQSHNMGSSDAFVTVLDPQGKPSYSTLFGGPNCDEGHAIAVDAQNRVYFAGATDGFQFPITPSACQPVHAAAGDDAFVAALDTNIAGANGLLYSTYLGGDGVDRAWGVALDSQSPPDVYVTGEAGYAGSGTQFPTTPGAFQRFQNGTPGNQGNDAFIARINPWWVGPQSLRYSTFLGGATGGEVGTAICVDRYNDACVTGETTSTDFPVTAGSAFQSANAGGEDAFVTRLLPDDSLGSNALRYSTYLGGGSDDGGNGIMVNNGYVYVTGFANKGNPDFPWTTGAYQTSCLGQDAFVTKFGRMSLVQLPIGYQFHAAVPPGPNVNVNIGGGMSAVFSQVSAPGTITVTITSPTYGVPASCRLLTSASYFAVSTTASYTGNVDLTFPWEPTDLTGPSSNLQLLHHGGGGWSNTTTSVDDTGDTITGRTGSFSDFEIVEQSPSSSPVPASSGWTLALVGLLGLAFAAKRLRRAAIS